MVTGRNDQVTWPLRPLDELTGLKIFELHGTELQGGHQETGQESLMNKQKMEVERDVGIDRAGWKTGPCRPDELNG